MSGKKKHFLSVYFISAYTRTAAVSTCEDTLSGRLFYFGIHSEYTHVCCQNDTLSKGLLYFGIHLQYTHVRCTKILNAVRVYTEIK